jgi:hypothetical protein
MLAVIGEPGTTHRYVEANLAMKEQALARLEEPANVVRLPGSERQLTSGKSETTPACLICPGTINLLAHLSQKIAFCVNK